MIQHLKVITALASLVAAALLASCAPKTTSKQYPAAQQVFTTSKQDADLDVKNKNPEELLKNLSADQQMKTAELFRSVKGLQLLSDRYNKASLQTLASGINDQFYSALNTTTKVRFEESPMISAGLAIGKEYLELGKRAVDVLETSDKNYAWPKEVKFAAVAAEMNRYLLWVVDKVATSKEQRQMLIEGKKEIDLKIAERQENIEDSIDSVNSAETATAAVEGLSGYLSSLRSELRTRLRAGYELPDGFEHRSKLSFLDKAGDLDDWGEEAS